MNRFPVRAVLLLTAASLLAVFATACGSSDDKPAGAKKMSFKLTDAGCDPHNVEAPAGPVVFEVENAGSSTVTELEVLDGDTILGEVENLSDGLSGSFSLTLEKGEYTLRCKGGEEEDGTLTVTGDAVAKTAPFVAAVEAGEVDEAKALYPAARVPYERIEPVAESSATSTRAKMMSRRWNGAAST